MIAKTGTGGGQGYMVEYRGSTFRAMSMEGRMTVCNMSIEWGARAGMIAPDEVTFDYLKGRPHAPSAPTGMPRSSTGRQLRTDDDAEFDAEIVMDAEELAPVRHLGHQPGQGAPLSSSVPDPADFEDDGDRVAATKALEYMGLEPVHRCATSRSTRCSSARAPTAGSKTCAPWPRIVDGRMVAARGADAGRSRFDARARPGRAGGSGPRSSSTPAPSGGRPVARCAWA